MEWRHIRASILSSISISQIFHIDVKWLSDEIVKDKYDII